MLLCYCMISYTYETITTSLVHVASLYVVKVTIYVSSILELCIVTYSSLENENR